MDHPIKEDPPARGTATKYDWVAILATVAGDPDGGWYRIWTGKKATAYVQGSKLRKQYSNFEIRSGKIDDTQGGIWARRKQV